MIPAFVINLPQCSERRNLMLASLARYSSVSAEVIDAVDGRLLPEADVSASVVSSNVLVRHTPVLRLTRGEIGCALSHVKALRTIVERGLPHGLLLEDDTLFSADFEHSLDLASRFLESCRRPSLVLLSARTFCSPKEVCWDGNLAIYPAYDAIGAYAYLANSAAASIISKTCFPLVSPFDHWFWHRERGVKLYSLVPHSASFVGGDDDSSLEPDRLGRNAEYKEWMNQQGPWARLRLRYPYQRLKRKWLMTFGHGRFHDKEWPDHLIR